MDEIFSEKQANELKWCQEAKIVLIAVPVIKVLQWFYITLGAPNS